MRDLDIRKRRIVAIASQIVESWMAKGEIEQSDEAIREAMPRAVRMATQAYNAAEEFVSG